MTTKRSTKKTAKAGTARKAAAPKATKKAAPVSVTGTLTLPPVGQKLTRTYNGKDHVVEVVKGGFRYEGTTYSSLTALAKEITGYKAISGPAFFGLWKREETK